MKKNNKFVEFVKTHKKGIAVAAGTVIGVVGAVAVGAIVKSKLPIYVDIEQPELSSGNWMGLSRCVKGEFDGCIVGCATAVDVTDLGKFGDALATIEGIDGHEPIRIVFGTENSFI